MKKITYKRIYKAILIFVTVLAIILPKETSLNNIERLKEDILLKRDGSLSVVETLKFENRLKLTEKIVKKYDGEALGIKNIKVYSNFFGIKRKLPLVESSSYISFERVPFVNTYNIEYDTKPLAKIEGEKGIYNIPLSFDVSEEKEEKIQYVERPKIDTLPDILNEEKRENEWALNDNSKWINNLEVNVKSEEGLNISSDKMIFVGLPNNTIDFKKDKILANILNVPKSTNAEVLLRIDKKELAEEKHDQLSKNLVDQKQSIESLNDRFNTFVKRKEKRNFLTYVYKKYLVYAVYLLIFEQLFNYIFMLLIAIKERKYRYSKDNIIEKRASKLGTNLVKTFALFEKDVYTNKAETVNLIQAILTKLSLNKFITFEKEYVHICYKEDSEIKDLDFMDKYILEKIYLADRDNDSNIKYSDLCRYFSTISSDVIMKLGEQVEKEKGKFVKEGVILTPMHRVDFSVILFVIPLLVILSIFKYINGVAAFLTFISLYIFAKLVVIVKKDGYSKKGIGLKYHMQGYEKYLKSLNAYIDQKEKIEKEVEEEKYTLSEKIRNKFKKNNKKEKEQIDNKTQDVIYRVYYGQKILHLDNLDQIKSLAEALSSYISYIDTRLFGGNIK